ncbi:MAG TPA: amino acid permease [Gemmatimonadales bacterium]|nr:amino acid permease [Gemmatimonadales bacterium]
MTSYLRSLGLFSTTMSVVGGIIGAGIFVSPAVVAQRVGSGGLTLAVWAFGGLVALAGAFCFAELGARAPRAGGGYVYLRDAFGRLPAFLYGWTLLLVIATGATAAVAVTFARYAIPLLGLPPGAERPLAVGAIVLLAALNYLGVRPAAFTQNVFTLLKLGALALVIIAGIALVPDGPTSSPPDNPVGMGGVGLWDVGRSVGLALIPVMFTYGGWQQTNFIAEEIVDAPRTLPRALVLGVGIVMVVYLLANGAYLRALGPAGLAASAAPAADTLEATLGAAGRRLISAGIAASTLGFLNLVILVTPRVFQAMAADGLFFDRIARLHPRHRTPAAAITLQAAWAVVLALSGTYAELLDYVVFGDWIFFGAAAATLFVYRARDGMAAGAPAFRVPAYRLVTGFFVLAAVYVMASAVRAEPTNAMKGAALIALGIPVYAYWSRK